jgi:hypothetical protein
MKKQANEIAVRNAASLAAQAWTKTGSRRAKGNERRRCARLQLVADTLGSASPSFVAFNHHSKRLCTLRDFTWLKRSRAE